MPLKKLLLWTGNLLDSELILEFLRGDSLMHANTTVLFYLTLSLRPASWSRGL